MEEDREQILADFQSCTGLEDVAECIMHLEATNWNLLEAINVVMPQETQTLPSEQAGRYSPIIDVVGPDPGDVPVPDKSPPRPVHSSGFPYDGPNPNYGHAIEVPHVIPTKILNVNVKYKGVTLPLHVPDTETVATIKSQLHAEFGVPPCRQELIGWRRNHITDDTKLSTLELPSDVALILATQDMPSSSCFFDSDHLAYVDRLQSMFKLVVMDDTNCKEYQLSFPGSRTISEVKQDVYDLTNIPVRFQKWTGWPEAATDGNMTLAGVGLDVPLHHLTVRREDNLLGAKKQETDLASSESSVEEFEDANECITMDDDFFRAEPSNKMIPLIPEGVVDERDAVAHFRKEFSARYGECHPIFFQGMLSEAMQSSCQRPVKQRRPLAIYLHHDASVLTHVFCTQMLCTEAIATYMTLNFITWAWDLTFEFNKSRFLTAVTHHMGVAASNAIQNIAIDNLPALMIISRLRSTTEVLTVIPGNVGLDELMTRLVHACEVFNSEMATEIREEEEREAREEVKRQQDVAYEESLMADRAKEEARRVEEEEKQKKELEQKVEKEREEELQKQKEAEKQAIRQCLAQQLPPEPPDTPGTVSHIRIRLPSGEIISRRFLSSTRLQVLLNFLASRGYPAEEYKVLSSWPRRDVTAMNPNHTLEELKLFPQETIMLQER